MRARTCMHDGEQTHPKRDTDLYAVHLRVIGAVYAGYNKNPTPVVHERRHAVQHRQQADHVFMQQTYKLQGDVGYRLDYTFNSSNSRAGGGTYCRVHTIRSRMARAQQAIDIKDNSKHNSTADNTGKADQLLSMR